MFGVLLLFLSDNALWFTRSLIDTTLYRQGTRPEADKAFFLPASAWDVFAWLDAHKAPKAILVGTDPDLMYLATAYTRLRTWYSHAYTTPHAARRREELLQFFASGAEPPEWRVRPILAVTDQSRAPERAKEILLTRGFAPTARFGDYEVFSRPGRPH